MVAFAASCIGLLLFLWISFGGSIPFAPRATAAASEFNEAVQLAQQSDVRISGVSVGKVVAVSLDRHTGLTQGGHPDRPPVRPATGGHARDPAREVAARRDLHRAHAGLANGAQAARRRDAPARPGRADRPARPDPLDVRPGDPPGVPGLDAAGRRSRSRIAARTSTPAFAELYPFATNVDSVLAVLNRDSAATSTLLRDGGQVFSALGPLAGRSCRASSATPTRCSRRPRRRTRRWPTRSGRSRRSPSPPG